MSAPSHSLAISERSLILIVALIQFVNILDFMMVMPLGPDFALALGIPTSDIGLIGGIYTFAAAFSGLAGGLFLDHYSRKRALMVALCGLTLATLAGAFVWSKETMLAARLVAGLFGGPVTALAMALIADYIPAQRRGAAMGKATGGFAAASVIGVPFGLELARLFSWHAPFIVTAVLGAAVTLLVLWKLPYHTPLAGKKSFTKRVCALTSMLRKKLAVLSYSMMAISMMSGFMIIPNIATHLQLNLHYPREQLGLLYFCGGILSFFGMRLAGSWMDRTSATLVSSVFTGLLILVLLFGFVFYPTPIPMLLLFSGFMVAMSGRSVTAQTLSSKVPAAAERAAYMSVQSAVTHFASALGAYYSSLILVEQDGVLLGVPTLAMTAICLSLLIPFIFAYVEKRVHPSRYPIVTFQPEDVL